MRKILSLLLVIVLIVSSFPVVFANSEESAKMTQSEYDSIAEILGKDDNDFVKMGLSKEKIREIKEYKIELANNIKKYSKYSENELEGLGFSEEQIKTFKKLDVGNPTEQQSRNLTTREMENCAKDADAFLSENLSRGLTGSVDMSLFLYRISGDEVTFKAKWEWTGAPLVRGLSESIGFSWTNGFELTDYNDLYIEVESDRSSEYIVPTSDKDTQNPDEGCRAKFPTADAGYLYRSGVCYLTLNNDDNESSTTMAWAYAHGTVQVAGFGISISGGSISISQTSIGMDKGLEKFYGLN